MKSKTKLIPFIIVAALVLSIGTVSVLALANNSGWHEVTPEEYEAIKAGDIKLDDGVPRRWNGGIELNVVESINKGSTYDASTAEIMIEILDPSVAIQSNVHVVTPEEYEAIKAGEIKLDDGVPRRWNGGIELNVVESINKGSTCDASTAEILVELINQGE